LSFKQGNAEIVGHSVGHHINLHPVDGRIEVDCVNPRLSEFVGAELVLKMAAWKLAVVGVGEGRKRNAEVSAGGACGVTKFY
jgi:hypothetical protein